MQIWRYVRRNEMDFKKSQSQSVRDNNKVEILVQSFKFRESKVKREYTLQAIPASGVY